MTREEAIDIVKCLAWHDLRPNEEDIEQAIEALEQESCDDKGEISDGYHTFNQLYHQRAILFATIVNQNIDIAWKSYKHSDEKYCFDRNGEWFIVGIDTPQGSYTYHYSKEYWDYFKCKELDCGKEWDGHTEEDVTRLLSLAQEPCSNAISREDALEIIAKTDITNGMKPVFTGKQVQALLNDLPSVQPAGRWILVSERLPKPNQYDGSVAMYYLVQNEYGDMLVASYDSNGWRQIYHHDYLKDEVVAWMFLPKLYSLDDD